MLFCHRFSSQEEVVGLLGGVRKKKLLSFLRREDAAFIVSDNLYLLLKRDKIARLLLASTVAASPDVKPYPEAEEP